MESVDNTLLKILISMSSCKFISKTKKIWNTIITFSLNLEGSVLNLWALKTFQESGCCRIHAPNIKIEGFYLTRDNGNAGFGF